MATWKKIVVSGSNISQLNNDSNYITAGGVAANSPNSFATMSINGTLVLADNPTGSLVFASSSGAGLNIVGSSAPDTITFNLISIPNASLANSSVTVGSTAISLGATSTTLAGLTSVTSTTFVGDLTGTATTASNITPAITNGADNRVLTANTNGTINGEANLTFDGSTLTVAGNLTVNGTTTTVNTTNLIVTDQFVLLGSGSVANKDGGIIIQSSAGDNTGFAYFLDNTTNPRWAFSSSVAANSTTVSPDEYVVSAKSVAGTWTAASAAPTYGGTTAGYGNIVIDANGGGDIWIYTI